MLTTDNVLPAAKNKTLLTDLTLVSFVMCASKFYHHIVAFNDDSERLNVSAAGAAKQLTGRYVEIGLIPGTNSNIVLDL